MTIERIDGGHRMSPAAVVGNLVFSAGRVAEANAGRDIGSQTREILDAIDALLERAGTDKSRLVSLSVSLASITNFNAMNVVQDAWVDKAKPAGARLRRGASGGQPIRRGDRLDHRAPTSSMRGER